jgi:hypothetical protein
MWRDKTSSLLVSLEPRHLDTQFIHLQVSLIYNEMLQLTQATSVKNVLPYV